MAFIAELRRRKVLQVAIGYLAVAWLLVQVTATILPAFDLPVWALRFVVLLFALGFPIAVLMAWALELTPEGVRLDVGTSAGKGMLAIAALFMAIALGWFFRGQMHPAQHVAQSAVAGTVSPQPKVDERSIAVLPLVNASNDPEQQFFSDGLSENLIDTLSRFDGLKVIGRMSSFRFRDDKGDSAAIGATLGAAYLLGGSVQRAGDLVRISASLVKAADGSTLWAEHYDRPYKNLFALQDEIAQAVAGALQVKLLSPEAAAAQDDRPPGGNIEAYNAYLHGMKYWHGQEFPEAAEYMAKAVQLDPAYAVAWARLSESLSTVATFWDDEPPELAREQLRKAHLAVDKAMQLAPGLGPVHTARAALLFYSFDHRGAAAECRRAVKLAPEDGMALNSCGFVLGGIGKLDEAIRLREHLLSIEPLYNVNYFDYARLLLAAGRLDEAEKYLRIAEGLSQPYVYGHMVVAILRGNADAAMNIATQVSADKRGLYMALAAQVGPDRAAADTALATALQGMASTESYSYRIAQIYALRGDAGHAVEWLERAKAPDLLFMLTDPLILRLRDDPRFIAFCRKIGLPPPSESEALDIDRIRALSSNRQARS